MPEDNRWDRTRPIVDQMLFPYYSDEITFAALTLNNAGLTSYGPYVIILKTEMIHHRATVFEENPLVFVQRHQLIVSDDIPPGYRACWEQRSELAMSKLYSKINTGSCASDYPLILMNPGKNTAEDEFVEVHIYGPIHPKAFERVIGPTPGTREDKVLLRSIETKLKMIDVPLEII